jgi:hypothetical protein
MPAASRTRTFSILVFLMLSLHGSAEAWVEPWVEARASALMRLETARALLTTTSLEEAVATVAELGAFRAEPMTFSPASIGVPLPAELAAPITSLLGAIQRAEAIASEAVHMSAAQFRDAQNEWERLLAEWIRTPAIEPAGLEDLRRLVDTRVDTQGLASASATIARAIDDALPSLRAAAASMGPNDDVVGCELGDVPGVLCVGGTGANTYDRDYALLVDLGGDDVHANSAGGADPLINGLPVAVTIDVGGNDTYRRPATATSEVAQGAGTLGGVGFLVDAAGSDVYEFEPTKANGRANGQGIGASGAGILADLGGSDRYSIRNTGSGVQEVNGQGAAGLGGFALALDAGGDDSYTLASRPQLQSMSGTVELGEAEAGGFGIGDVGGVAAFANSGGTDTMTIEAVVGPPGPGQTQAAGRSANILAFGHGGAGVGVALAGPGDTTWSARSETNAALLGDFGSNAFVGGSGQGALGGFGALHDAGGNDTYRSVAITHVVRERSIDDSCSCSRVDAVAMAGLANILATGYGAAGGTGILHDAAGNDRYLDAASTFAEAIAHDGRANVLGDGAVSARAEATTADADLYVQGAGLVGSGFLLDDSGNDVYEASAVSEATATATASDPDAVTEGVANSGSADTLFAQAAGQLGGYGELTDTGGTDQYRGIGTSTAVAQPPTGGAAGLMASSVQGSVDLGGIAKLSDVDGGAPDSFSATPPDTACFGTRGQGTWGDCGIGVGVGSNA